MPTFSRQNGTGSTAAGPATGTGATVAGPDDTTVAHWNNPKVDDRGHADRVDTAELRTDEIAAAGYDQHTGSVAAGPDTSTDRSGRSGFGDRPPADAGRKPRASLLATLALILGVASALLVLSGPLLGYGMALAGVALILSLLGLRATRRRHVAGKSDALIGLVLSLAALVVGGLALTGSLNWLGTDVQSVNNLRNWLDARFVDRF